MIVLLFITTVVSAVQFQPNDEVHLMRDTPLLFLDKPLRQGVAGETFKVLAYQPAQKQVFLAAKDPTGKEIAVSVAEESVSLVPSDKAKVQANVLAAASNQQFTVAKNLLDQALRASPDDVDLHSMSIALEAVNRSAQQLSQASAGQQTVEADLKRRRQNAVVTDRSNPLDPSDHSGRQRAAQMRAEANRIEAQSKQVLQTAQSDYEAVLSALRATAQEQTPGPIPPKVVKYPSFQPGLPMTAEQSRQLRQAQEQAQRENDRLQRARNDALKEWLDDESVRPTGVSASKPSYEETLDFINGRLARFQQRLWFGKNHQKLIYRSYDHIALLDPADLSSDVKTIQRQDGSGPHFFVQLQTLGDHNGIEFLDRAGAESRFGHSLTMECEDNVEADRVAAACRHLITMFGGKPEPF